MIKFQEAFERVMAHQAEFGLEQVPLMQSLGRILAEDILADRDFPPFDRSTKDGIAISYADFESGIREFRVQEVAPAGEARKSVHRSGNCIEIMTGAIIPQGTDTVIMYEEVEMSGGKARLNNPPLQGQNIHHRGVDEKAGDILIRKGELIGPEMIGVLATVGKAMVQVQKLPSVLVISTGNELVEVDQTPEPHQIRKSNVLTLQADLVRRQIPNDTLHLPDHPDEILEKLKQAISNYDVLLLSGGVSKGKFDHIPDSLHQLGVEQFFHKVYQRPGKPFWFGHHAEQHCTVFSFPGNPVSTWACYQVYFIPWLQKQLNAKAIANQAVLRSEFEIKEPFTRLMLMRKDRQGKVAPLDNSGSGDLTALIKADGIAVLQPGSYPAGTEVLFYTFT